MKKFLSKKDVKARTLISDAERDRRIKAGTFPKGTKLGRYHNSRVGWLETEIDAWIDAQISKNDPDDTSS